MRKRQLIIFLLAVFLAGSFIGNASARGGIFVIEPMQEVTESVKLTVPDEVYGNVSVTGGYIDFYVTSPSGNIFLCHNKTAFTSFNFTAIENGNYTLHLINAWSSNNVTAILDYRVHFIVNLQSTISVTFNTVSTTTVLTVPAPSPVEWIDPLHIIVEILKTVGIPIILWFIDKVWALFEWLNWRKKHGKSKTPVVISLTDKIAHILNVRKS